MIWFASAFALSKLRPAISLHTRVCTFLRPTSSITSDSLRLKNTE